ncbi:hypothetical protein CAPTEDRAFT_217565 [Capitella teleta]|uniref:Uncharacterized protein n=1 Tax=Capitella teleta TaxID=283909 RepID=R7TJ71_CAPTE|nr:hypothetical protein CAPTEDRAFT_217565 [Capitella teleta]|eukprot:ELT91155.1 hypothetical protein CAPTEDRAFT_217565 [Capitella teleta]
MKCKHETYYDYDTNNDLCEDCGLLMKKDRLYEKGDYIDFKIYGYPVNTNRSVQNLKQNLRKYRFPEHIVNQAIYWFRLDQNEKWSKKVMSQYLAKAAWQFGNSLTLNDIEQAMKIPITQIPKELTIPFKEEKSPIMAEDAPEFFYVSENSLASAVTTIQNDPGTLFDPNDPNVLILTNGDHVSITKAGSGAVEETVVDTEILPTSQEPEVSIENAVRDQSISVLSSPKRKTTVCKENPYNDPVDPDSKFTFRIFNCLRDVETIIQRVQEEVGVKFFCLSKGKNFGIEENWDYTKCDRHKTRGDKYQILYKSSDYEKSMGRTSLPFVPAGSPPYLAVSSCIMCCHHMTTDTNKPPKSKKKQAV